MGVGRTGRRREVLMRKLHVQSGDIGTGIGYVPLLRFRRDKRGIPCGNVPFLCSSSTSEGEAFRSAGQVLLKVDLRVLAECSLGWGGIGLM